MSDAFPPTGDAGAAVVSGGSAEPMTAAETLPPPTVEANERLDRIEGAIGRLADLVGGVVQTVHTLEQRSPGETAAAPVIAAEPPQVNPADVEHPPIGEGDGWQRLQAIEHRLTTWEPFILDLVRVGGTLVPGGIGQMLSQIAAQLGHQA